MNIQYKNYQAEFVHLEFPDGVPLLGLRTYELRDGEWAAIDRGSYCTNLSVDTDPEIMEEALCSIVFGLDLREGDTEAGGDAVDRFIMDASDLTEAHFTESDGTISTFFREQVGE